MELDESEEEEVKIVIQAGLMCTQHSHSRPTMSEVVAKLLSETYVRFQLRRPTFIRTGNENSPTDVPETISNAKMSMSSFSGRWTWIYSRDKEELANFYGLKTWKSLDVCAFILRNYWSECHLAYFLASIYKIKLSKIFCVKIKYNNYI